MTAIERLLVSVLAAVVLLVVGILGVRAYGAHRYDAGHAAAVAERAQADAAAVLKRTRENVVQAARQDETNATITKEKDDEIADLRRRLAAAPRLRVGPAVCPDRPAAPAKAKSPTSGDSPDPSPGLVSSRADADFKQLIQDVEQDLATGRACQAFIEKNGLAP
jgi:Tfp pilus assembly protein PilV